MRSFMKIKPSRNSKITLLFTDIGKSCVVNFERRKFANLQYPSPIHSHSLNIYILGYLVGLDV